jgi:heme exporter protein D
MIQFRFDTLAELWAMNGHGPYVWASYGITLAALLVLVIYPLYQQKKFLKDTALREERIRRAQKASSSSDSPN